ncbi:MAG: ABC transporter substrate-binding protein [Gemmataceae bacterium]
MTRTVSLICFCLIVTGFSASLEAQQPPKDKKPLPAAPRAFPREEEDPLSPGIVKKIDPDEETAEVNVPKGAAYFKLGQISRLVMMTKDPVLKEFYHSYAVAFDRIDEGGGKRTRVCPLPKHRSQPFPARFGAFELTDANAPKPRARAFEFSRISGIRHFEELAIEQARNLTKPTPENGATPLEKLPASVKAEAAETLLTDTLFFTTTAADQGKRKGPGWEAVRKQVSSELAVVRGKRLKQAVADQNWALARELGQHMIALYNATPELLEEVYSAKLAEAEAVLESANERPTELERVYLALAEYEAKSPSPDKARIGKVRGKLNELSKKLLDRANDLVTKDPAAAGRLVTAASRFDPENPTVATLRSVLNIDYSVLSVGYRRMPTWMSPSMARYDSEKHAVDLLFEGLTEPVPDEILGMTYRPVLATRIPDVTPNVRIFQLQRAATWNGGDRSGLDVADVRGTYDLLKQRPGTWASYPLDWISEIRADDPTRVRVTFSRGHIDARNLVSFKILPARWLASQGKAADEISFATRPFGTGPFTLVDTKPGEVLFRANPAYGRRADRPGQPSIKEIRFVNLNDYRDPVAEFTKEAVHIIPDVPTTELDRYRNVTTSTGKMAQIVTAREDQRMWILAINHRNPTLRDTAIRRGIAHAIDRDQILDNVYRIPASVEKPHAPMTGPFPPNSWASPKLNFNPGAAQNAASQATPPLLNRDLASAKFTEYLKSNGNKTINLLYPADDAQAKKACERIKKNIEDLAKFEGNALTIQLEGAVPSDYFRRIYEEHAFELAYYAFDYPDDFFPFALGAALDSNAAGRNGRNIFGYLVTDATYVPTETDRSLGKLLGDIRLYRDPAKLTQMAGEIHAKFNEVMPFVPLWRLDRHMVISSAVKIWTDDSPHPLPPQFLEPSRLFLNISKWRVE